MVIREFGDSSGRTNVRVPDTATVHVGSDIRVAWVGTLDGTERCISVHGEFRLEATLGGCDDVWLRSKEDKGDEEPYG